MPDATRRVTAGASWGASFGSLRREGCLSRGFGRYVTSRRGVGAGLEQGAFVPEASAVLRSGRRTVEGEWTHKEMCLRQELVASLFVARLFLGFSFNRLAFRRKCKKHSFLENALGLRAPAGDVCGRWVFYSTCRKEL